MLVLYFVAPLGLDDQPLPLPVATAVSVVLALGLAGIIGHKIVAVLEGRSTTGITGLIILLVLVVVAFSVAYFALERSDPGQVHGLRTRLDSLYFTLTTLVTVGYGDVSARGQAARGVASVQMVFNAVFVAGLVRAMLYEAQVRRQGSPTPPGSWSP
jgi:voltage-gated potassium channel